MERIFYLLVTIPLMLSSCSSNQKSNPSIAQQAKKELPSESSQQVKSRLTEILSQDSSITDWERNKLLSLIEESFEKNKEIEILANQKKILLVREYTKPFPDLSRIELIKTDIKKTHSRKIDNLMSYFEKMTKIINKHPKSSEKFIDRYIEDMPFNQ